MTHAATLWAEWLLDRLDYDLGAAVGVGLPVDAIAIGSAHLTHGAQLAIHVGGLPPEVMAAYLRALATAVERGASVLPMMITAPPVGRA